MSVGETHVGRRRRQDADVPFVTPGPNTSLREGELSLLLGPSCGGIPIYHPCGCVCGKRLWKCTPPALLVMEMTELLLATGDQLGKDMQWNAYVRSREFESNPLKARFFWWFRI